MKISFVRTLIVLLCIPFGLAAQGTQAVTYRLSQPDSIYGVRASVMEKGSARTLVRELDQPLADSTVKGHRVCIFMEKNQSARENAFAAEEKFKAQFPNIASYVIYDKSSYWKVLVGNCLSIDEVTILKGKAEKLFPGKPFIVQEDIPITEFGKKGEDIASAEYLKKTDTENSEQEATGPYIFQNQAF